MVWMCRPPEGLLTTRYVAKVLLCQFEHEVELGRVGERFSGTVTFCRHSSNNTSLLKGYQMAVQAGARNTCSCGKFSCGTWTHESKASKNFRLGAASDHAHHSFNLRREIGINEGGHLTIMPDGSNLRRVIAPPYY